MVIDSSVTSSLRVQYLPSPRGKGMLEQILASKFILVLVLPFVLLILFGGWLAIYTRGGRPLSLKLRGLGLTIEIDTRTQCAASQKDTT